MMIRKERKTQWLVWFFLLICVCCLHVGAVSAASGKPSLNHSKVTLYLQEEGKQLILKNAKGTVKWHSSDKKVAAVKAGMLTAKGTGKCTVTAKYKKKSYVCRVTVKKRLKKQKIVLAGGSNLKRWGKSTAVFPTKKVANMAVGGSCVRDWRKNYPEWIVQQQPSAVILYVGANDLAGGAAKDGMTVAGEVCGFLKILQNEIPGVPVFYVSVVPSPGRWGTWKEAKVNNRLVKKYCASRKNLYFIDCEKEFLNKKGKPKSSLFQQDGIHLNQKGKKIWDQLIGKKVKKKVTIK